MTFGDGGSDPEIREELHRLAEERGAEYLLGILSEFDPESAERLHPNNMRRIIRAIEFYRTTGKTISEHQRETKLTESRYEPIMVMPDYERDVLYERINIRVDKMLAEGLADEVKRLLAMGCTPESQSMQGIGYKETIEYISGKISLEECAELIKMNTRRYAKRQLTWFRRDERIVLLKPGESIGEKISEKFKNFS